MLCGAFSVFMIRFGAISTQIPTHIENVDCSKHGCTIKDNKVIKYNELHYEMKPCIFEWVYLARADSTIYGILQQTIKMVCIA